jgi:hypothetical protein
MDDLADCVPDQEGWVFGKRAAANGMASMALEAAGSVAAAQVCAGPSNGLAAAAIETRSHRLRFVDEKDKEDSRQAQGLLLPISVPLMYRRDEDVLSALVEREKAAGRGKLPEAAAAMGLRSFTSGSQRLQEEQEQQLAQGRLLVAVEMWMPRDKDLLDQLAARAGVVAKLRANAGDGGTREDISGVAASSLVLGAPRGLGCGVVRHAVKDYVAAQPEEEQKEFFQWQGREGGLIYFVNASFADGVSLETPDGRLFLPPRVLYDTACQPALMSAEYGAAMGLRATPLPEPRHLIKADGQLAKVDKQFAGVRVWLKKGTDEAVSVDLNFLAIPGGGRLYQVTFPTVLDHQVGGLGVDRVEQCYRYRPFYATKADKHTVAELPVRGWQVASQVDTAAAVLAWQEVSEEEWQAAEAASQQAVGSMVQGIFAKVVARVVREEVVAAVVAAAVAGVAGQHSALQVQPARGWRINELDQEQRSWQSVQGGVGYALGQGLASVLLGVSALVLLQAACWNPWEAVVVWVVRRVMMGMGLKGFGPRVAQKGLRQHWVHPPVRLRGDVQGQCRQEAGGEVT